jgi:glycosyltransferase involved in cell wall biosynthesis
MPVHNGARHIGSAIDSVLAQTLTDFELIVVDDASTDDTANVVARIRDRRVRVERHDRNRGLPRALNTGLAAATGAYIARLDHDDVAHRERFARQAECLDAEPRTALVGSRARRIDGSGVVLGTVERPVSTPGIRWFALLENPFIHSAAMFRADVAAALGGYREDVPLAEDFDLWGRMMAAHDVRNLEEPLVDYREWPQSIMSNAARDGGATGNAVLRQSIATIIQRHIAAELAWQVTDTEARVLAGFSAGIPRDDRAGFLNLFDRMCETFERKHPDALASRDYRRTVARAVSTIAARLVPPSRGGAAAVFGHAIRRAPHLAGEVSWLRALALVTIGRRPAAAATGVVTP